MRKYYTRPCNFYYGNYAKNLVKIKKALPLAGNSNISFDQLEIFQRKIGGGIKSYIYSINEIKKLNKEIKNRVKIDLKRITNKRKSISRLKFDNPHIIGVLNITPDSFSDGGLFFEESKAYEQANLMINDGASIIDIGGESTRPGSKLINDKEEWNRVENTIKNLKKNFSNIILSLDTRKSYVMKKGIESGINIINDVSGLNFDKKSFDLINSKKIPFVLHHMQGTPDTMQNNPKYDDIVTDIVRNLSYKIDLAKKAGILDIIIDPGFGFGKTLEQNFKILENLSFFKQLEQPIMVGVSRKSMIYKLLGISPKDALNGSTCLNSISLNNGANIIRVHDVKEAKEVVNLISFMKENS